MKKLISCFFVLAMCLGLMSQKASAAPGWPANYEGVMLQGFYWDSYDETKWTNLEAKADEYSKYFKLIWVPNSAKSASGYMGYDPVYWFTNHTTRFGNESQLRSMIATYKAKGVGIIEDVVINHRSGKSNWTDFPSEVWQGVTYHIGVDGICSTDEVKDQPGQAKPTGAPDTGEDFNGSRDLDHTNANVQLNCKAYTKFLLSDLGYTGFRYDMVKGFHGRYIKIYNEYSQPTYSVGECFDGNYDVVAAWIEATGKTSAAFDFPFKFAVNDAFASNDMRKLSWKANGTTDQPAGMIHYGYNQYAVTFIDNHDTYRDHNKFNGNVLAANAFMLSCPGTPCVFLAHWLANKAAIGAMIDARNLAGVHNMSAVRVLKLEQNCYMAEVTGTRGTLAVKIGSSMDSPAGYSNSDIKASGTNYCIWVKASGGNQGGGNQGGNNTGSGFTVYFKNDKGWATPYIHYWGASESSWPGVAMTKSGDVWKYDVPAGTSGLLFNAGDGDATKTGDFVAQANHLYTTSGDQGVYDPNAKNPDGPFKVYFDNSSSNWTTPHIHHWGSTESSWPGVAMSTHSGSVWVYTVPAGTTGILFNAGDGDATKTSDFVAWADHLYTASGDQGVYSGAGGGNQGGGNQGGGTDPTPGGYVYLIGEPAGGWMPNVGTKVDGSNGVYTFTGEFTDVDGDGICYFGFADALASSATDWDTLNSQRYGSALNDELPAPDANGNTISDHYIVTVGSSNPVDYPNGTSWGIAAGRYTVTLDTKNMTLTVSNPGQGGGNQGGGNTDPTPTPDGYVYIIGEPAGGWMPNVGTKVDGSNGVYTFTGEFTDVDGDGICYFGFADALASSATDWDTLNSQRYGSALNDELPAPDANGNTISDHYIVTVGSSNPVDYPNGTSWGIAPGRYTVTLDTKNMTLTVSNPGQGGGNQGGGGNTDPTPTPDGYVYIIGEPAGGWMPNVGTKVDGSNGVYIYAGEFTDVDGDGVSYFGFADALASSATDWDTLNSQRYGSALNDELPAPDANGNTISDHYIVTVGSSNPVDYPNGTSWGIVPGRYTVTLDTKNMTLKVDTYSGIEEIEVEEFEPVYYNLQGMRIENPGKGVFIRVQGTNVTKVYLR